LVSEKWLSPYLRPYTEAGLFGVRNNTIYLRHMLDELEFIRQSTNDVTEEAFLANPLLQHGIVRAIEVLGEAVKKYLKTRFAMLILRFPGGILPERGTNSVTDILRSNWIWSGISCSVMFPIFSKRLSGC
ncbi:MAG: hypothetical protein MJ014_05105, partial [Methanocorpusculum sp.]|nr:hypothetical protein [Methanocorpusculum sp.]